MPDDLAIFDAENNELRMPSFEEVLPGSSYIETTGGPLELHLKNITGVNKLNRELYTAPSFPYEIAAYVRLSLDGQSFTDSPWFIGSFAPDEVKTVFLDIIMPEDAEPGPNQRCRLKIRINNQHG